MWGGGNLEDLLQSFVTKINSLESYISNIEKTISGIQKLEVGSIIMYSGNNNIMSDFLLCDGSAVSRTTYADLFAVIGTTYGTGDGSTTFNLPNMVGRFPEGASSVGTYKSAGLPNIYADFAVNTQWNIASASGAIYQWTDIQANSADGSTYHTGYATTRYYFSASNSNGIYGSSTTVQPASLTLKYMIKYQ